MAPRARGAEPATATPASSARPSVAAIVKAPKQSEKTRPTPLGATLYATTKALVRWTEENQRAIVSARAEFDLRAAAPTPSA